MSVRAPSPAIIVTLFTRSRSPLPLGNTLSQRYLRGQILLAFLLKFLGLFLFLLLFLFLFLPFLLFLLGFGLGLFPLWLPIVVIVFGGGGQFEVVVLLA